MSNQNDTHELMIALRDAFNKHAAKMESFQEQTNKILKAHSDEIWGTDDENIGLKAKMRDVTEERKREREARVWWRGAVGVPVVGLVLDKLVTIFQITHK